MSSSKDTREADEVSPRETKKGRGPLSRGAALMIAAAFVFSALSGILSALSLNAVLIFVVAGAGLALLAALVGQATEQLGSYLGSGATGVLQSALGNLPELVVGIFALRAGLIGVVQAALVGSILGNSLFVLGLAFFLGGLRNGRQRFASDTPRMIANLTLLAVAALAIPTLVSFLHTPAVGHEEALSVACAGILLVVFIASIPMSLKGGPMHLPKDPSEVTPSWPIWLAIALLVGAGVGS